MSDYFELSLLPQLTLLMCTLIRLLYKVKQTVFIDSITKYTVDGERFGGLNVRVFNLTEVFTEIFSRFLGKKCLLFSISKERRLYSWEKFRGTLENREKCECLAQQIFPRLRYFMSIG